VSALNGAITITFKVVTTQRPVTLVPLFQPTTTPSPSSTTTEVPSTEKATTAEPTYTTTGTTERPTTVSTVSTGATTSKERAPSVLLDALSVTSSFSTTATPNLR
jgi:hypothetical protein